MKYLVTMVTLVVLILHRTDALQCYACDSVLKNGEVNPEKSVPCDEASVTTCEDGKNACATMSTSVTVEMMGFVVEQDSIGYRCTEMSDENTICSALRATPTIKSVKECSVDFCQTDLCNGNGETEDSGDTDGGNEDGNDGGNGGGNGGGDGGGNNDEDNDGNEGGNGGQGEETNDETDEETDDETDEKTDDESGTSGLAYFLVVLLNISLSTILQTKQT